DAVGVNEFSRVANRASRADRHERVARSVAAALTNRSRDAKIGSAVRHFRELRPDAAGGQECGVDIPTRTRSREARESNAGPAETLRDIARDVDADEVERHTRRLGLAQGRQAVADLFPA